MSINQSRELHDKEYKPVILCLTRKFYEEEDHFVLEGRCLVRIEQAKGNPDTSLIRMEYAPDRFCEITFASRYGKQVRPGIYRNRFRFSIPLEDLESVEGRHRLEFLYDGQFRGSFLYSAFGVVKSRKTKKKGFCRNGMYYTIHQSPRNRMYLNVEAANIPSIANLTNEISLEEDQVVVSAWCLTRLRNYERSRKVDTERLYVEYNEGCTSKFQFRFRTGLSLFGLLYLNRYSFRIPLTEVLEFDIQNKLLSFYDQKSYNRIRYHLLDGSRGTYRNSKVAVKDNTAIYLRQSVGNSLYLTVRDRNFFDDPEHNAMIKKANRAAKSLCKKDYILMYEKECEKYEESASILFEKLIDTGYDNVYYILNKDNKALLTMPEKYRSHIIEKHSFQHVQYFLGCHKFIATETLGHGLQLRIANRIVARKVNSKDLQYVFLQHGVMYMISLDAEMRTGFRLEGLDLYRVVVSSQKEAEHFMELAAFPPEELYITGLAKFDRSVREETADRIVIMPTWRRWETNQARIDFSSTDYYKMIERIISAIPADLKDKIVILPHPLMQKSLELGENSVETYVLEGKTHDEILRQCRLLITDYSSIAYDAFYRGANVIFYWEEKEACLEHYGGGHLMINEDNIYGDICYDPTQLAAVIRKNYEEPQTEANIAAYRQIVQFHDNRNTERIMEKLKADRML